MKRRLFVFLLAIAMIATTARESNAWGRYYNGYGWGGPISYRYYGYGNGPYGNRGYGYGNGGYIDYGMASPYGFGLSFY